MWQSLRTIVLVSQSKKLETPNLRFRHVACSQTEAFIPSKLCIIFQVFEWWSHAPLFCDKATNTENEMLLPGFLLAMLFVLVFLIVTVSQLIPDFCIILCRVSSFHNDLADSVAYVFLLKQLIVSNISEVSGSILEHMQQLDSIVTTVDVLQRAEKLLRFCRKVGIYVILPPCGALWLDF